MFLETYRDVIELPIVERDTFKDGLKLFKCNIKSETSYGVIFAPGTYNLALTMAAVMDMIIDTAIEKQLGHSIYISGIISTKIISIHELNYLLPVLKPPNVTS